MTDNEKPMTTEAQIAFLNETSKYFSRRAAGCAEDIEVWANVYNAEICLKIAASIQSEQSARADERRKTLEECKQIALALRDEADEGKWPDVRNPDWSMGLSFGANLIGKRIDRKLQEDKEAAAHFRVQIEKSNDR